MNTSATPFPNNEDDGFNDLLPAESINPKPATDKYAALPHEMKLAKSWLVYRLEPGINGKKNKIPYDPKTGRKANNPQLGVTFEVAVAAEKDYDGIGFYVESPFLVVDIDGCVNQATGDIESYAVEIVRALDSYTEASPSGKGLHVWVYAEKPGDKCRRGIEIYSTKRFMTVTGFHVEGTPTDIRKVDIALIYDRMLAGDFLEPEKKPAAVARATTTARAVNEPAKIRSESTATTSKLELLMSGSILSAKPFVIEDGRGNSVEYPSQSEADAALAVLLAFKHEGDAEKIDADFRFSSLYRAKWDRVDYRNATVKSARRIYDERRSATQQAAPVNAPEDIKGTSLFIFKTAEEVARAIELGFNALVASDFKPPLDPPFNRVVLCGRWDERFHEISDAVPGKGAIGTSLPRDNSNPKKLRSGRPGFAQSLTDVPADEAAAYLEDVLAMQGVIDASVKKPSTRTVEVPVDSRIEVTENNESAAQDDAQIVSEMPQSALASTRLGDIYADLFEPNDWPLDLALPALVTAASVLVPPLIPEPGVIYGDDNMVNLYTALIAKVGGGKSQVIEWAAKALQIWDAPIGRHYLEGKWGSAEQLLHTLHANKETLMSSALINPDELSHLFTKAAIPNSSFPSVLTTSFYRRRQNITIARNKLLSLDLAISLIGGVVDEEFGSVYNAGTIGGLYDRTMFGEVPPDFQWIHRDYPRPQSRLPLEPAPVPIRSDGSVTEVEKAWRKEDSELGRIVEITIRLAKIYASMDGRPIVTGKDLEALKGFALRQKTIRLVRQPNPGMVPDAIFANAVMGWLRAHTRGEWVTIAKLKTGVHCYEMKLGPNVAERCLQAMARADRIEIWLPKDRPGNDVPLPSGYAGARPRLGLVRLAC